MKKKEDLEAIVDLLHEYCVEHNEDYALVCVIDNAGAGDIGADQPDHDAVSVFRDYKRWTPAAATAKRSGK